MRIRFSGLGGQGVVSAGIIYGHAAMFAGHNVLQNQSYGSTTRGGVTTADVTFEAGEIHELECPDFDVLIALCQEAHDRFRTTLRAGGVLITERSLVDVAPATVADVRHVAIPAIEVAREKLGRQILANILALGALSQVVTEVGGDPLQRAIAANVPPGTVALNRRAFELGSALVIPTIEPGGRLDNILP